ncbi:MAG: type III-D CRISPR-associated RAMP protein Csx10 [Blastocatellia bacterium]
MKAIVYRVELLEPVLVSDIEGDPNSAVAFDYLPGSVLRGVFIGRYLGADDDGALAQDATARRLFFSGQTRYLNGYPLDRLGRRALPTPRSWQRKKDDEKKVYDFAREAPPDAFDEGVQWERVNNPFCAVERDQARLVKPERRIAVHTARTRRFGRAMPQQVIDKQDKQENDQPGAVYRYDALAAGQIFESVILCEDEDEARLKQWLQGEIKLGKARSGGYGRAQLQLVKQAPQTKPWSEYQRQALDALLDDEDESDEPDEERVALFVVTLLSDALLRDDCGQHVVEARAMDTLLQRELVTELKPERAFLGERIVGGFNRKWGMPLPQAAAIAMGSVFVYQVNGTLNRQRVNTLLERGIGERRAEGFGRLAINWQAEEELTLDTFQPTPTGARPAPLTGAAQEMAQLMAARLLRQHLDRKVVELANQIGRARGRQGFVMANPPPNSQLARLRSVLHEALRQSPPDPGKVEIYLKDIGERAVTRRQFENARIEEKPLLRWLTEKLRTAEAGFQKSFDVESANLRGVGGVKPGLTEKLRHEYLLRFVDAVLARAAKQKREEG